MAFFAVESEHKKISRQLDIDMLIRMQKMLFERYKSWDYFHFHISASDTNVGICTYTGEIVLTKWFVWHEIQLKLIK